MTDEELISTCTDGIRMSHLAHAKRIEFDWKMAMARAERLVPPGCDIDIFGDRTVKEESLCKKWPEPKAEQHGNDDPGDCAR